ncbi:MAG: response regulator [Sandaracinaceae bacterium]
MSSESGTDAIRVVIVDDHPLLRSGLRGALEATRNVHVVAEADGADEALERCRELQPDVLVTDIAMADIDGLELITELQSWHRRPEIVVLSMHNEFAAKAFRLGARGYVAKEDAANEIADCVAAVTRGERYVSASVPSEAHPRAAGASELTDTERRVLRLVATHLTSREIAKKLSVSRRTVDNHRANICRRLDLSGPHALLRFALSEEGRRAAAY